MSDNKHVEIKFKIILIGLISGFIASLWTILPFFVAGLSNIFYITIIAGIILLLVLTPRKKVSMLQSGISMVIVFVAISYLFVPFGSSLIFSENAELTATEGLEALNLKLPGLFCPGCAYASQSALKGIPGVVGAKVSFATKSGFVVYDPSIVTPEKILSNNIIRAYGGYIE